MEKPFKRAGSIDRANSLKLVHSKIKITKKAVQVIAPPNF